MMTFSTDTPLNSDHDMLVGDFFEAHGKAVRVRGILEYNSTDDGSQRWSVDAKYRSTDGTMRAVTYRTPKLRAAIIARFAR